MHLGTKVAIFDEATGTAVDVTSSSQQDVRVLTISPDREPSTAIGSTTVAPAGASLIRAEDGPCLSAFLAEWDESRRKSSIRSAQLSNITTEIWNTVQQTARLTVASYEVKKAPVHDDSYQAMVILLLANSLNPNFKPVVVLTEVRDSWVFLWLQGQCLWHSAQDRPAAAGDLEDMLQQEVQQQELNNSEVQTLSKEDCDRLGIYKRQIFDPTANGHRYRQDTSLAHTTDSLTAEQAAITKVQYMLDLFNQILRVPRMGPRPSVPYA
ncbi:TPA: hypothetical protein ACH3X1_000733 [Trebouxia sp. C0004]